MNNKIDIIIPLSCESFNGKNDELRILLRSIEKNAQGAGRVLVVSDCAPAWLSDSVNVLKIGDTHKHNKDANLIVKTLAGIHWLGCDRFCFCADDNVFVRPINLSELPVICNNRSFEEFAPPSDKEWEGYKRRMYHTMYLAQYVLLKDKLRWNFDCHAPQVFNAPPILAGINRLDWVTPPGVCIYTLFRALEGITNGLWQNNWKETCESKEEGDAVKFDKFFLGYNDRGFNSSLREKLFNLFPNKSRYERA